MLHFFKTVFLTACLLWLPWAQAQQVVIVPVRSYGNGETEASAIKDAGCKLKFIRLNRGHI